MSDARVRMVLGTWAPIAAATTVLCLFVNLAVQQNFRTTADDPQIQLAEDGAAMLAAGGQPHALSARPSSPLPEARTAVPVDIGQSLAPWIAVYGSGGTRLSSNGRLHGALPELPPGIFDYVRDNGEDRVTWKPGPGLRIALDIRRVDGANKPFFVAAGRSLRETERRVDSLNLITLLGLATVLSSPHLLAAFLFNRGRAGVGLMARHRGWSNRRLRRRARSRVRRDGVPRVRI